MQRLAAALVDFVLFQLVWLAAVAGAGSGRLHVGPLAVTALLVFAALRRTPAERRRLAGVAVALAGAGLLVDSALQWAGLIRYAGGGAWAPAWIAAMWAQLAVTLPALAPLARRPGLAAMLGAVGGPLAYSAGVRLGAATVGPEPALTWTALALVWALVVPALASGAAALERRHHPTGRAPRPAPVPSPETPR